MTGQHRWLIGAAWLPTCLLTGCLFRGAAESPLPATDRPALTSAATEAPGATPEEPGTPPPPPPPPEALSDYRPMPKAPAAPAQLTSSSSVERVALSQPSDPPAEAAAPKPPAGKPSGDEPTKRPAAPVAATPELAPRKEDPPLLAALRCALEKHPDEARQLLAKHDKSDPKLLFALVQLTAGLGAGELEKLPPAEMAATLEQLHTLAASLKKHAPLTLENMLLCRHIEGFGRYETLPADYRFQAAAEGCPGERVQVYVEVRNFSARPRDGQFATALDSVLEVRDAQRRKVAVMKLGECQDVSRTPRHDYFLNFQFHVPPQLSPGLYTLWVTVKDTTDGPVNGDGADSRVARRSLDFQVRPRADSSTPVSKTSAESPR